MQSKFRSKTVEVRRIIAEAFQTHLQDERVTQATSRILDKLKGEEPPNDTPEVCPDPVALKLTELGFPFNPNAPIIIQGWKDDFPNQDDVIIRAITMAHARNARNLNYIDKIIIDWKANGVPPTREQQIANAKQRPVRQTSQDVQDELQAWLSKKQGATINA